MYDDVDVKKKKSEKKEIIQEKQQNEVEETKETKKVVGLKADWVSIFVKFFVFLLIAFLLIFIITKLRNFGNQDTFSNNLEKMREAAYLYYKKEERRPSAVGDSLRMTLKDMVDARLVTDLKEKDTPCSQDFSYVDLTKQDTEHYDMNVYLTCGGEAREGSYDVTYKSSNSQSSKDDSETVATPVTLYEQKRIVTTKNEYSCPSGYVLNGKYCNGVETTVSMSANPVYKVTPRREYQASYKAPGYTYEYIDAISNTQEDSFKCQNGYELVGKKCIRKIDALIRTQDSYECPKGSVREGRYCMYKTNATYNDEIAYCSKGTLINGHECYIKKAYSVKCISGSYDSSVKSCYKTYSASKVLSDWMFDSKVTYSSRTTPRDKDTIRYEYDYEKSNGSIVYKKYIKKYVSTCDDGDELFGNICRHYDQSYIKKYCSGGYHLNSTETECYTTTEAKYKNTKGTYTCPDGYKKGGSGTSSYCYKYEKGTKKTLEEAYCLKGYDLTSDGECVKVSDATKVEGRVTYTCPDGYLSRGSGASTICYKKTSTESYYYCKNSSLTLEGKLCTSPEKVEFLRYSCPKGYSLSGDMCYRTSKTPAILATKVSEASSRTEKIWSKEKILDGWTWTGKTKQE